MIPRIDAAALLAGNSDAIKLSAQAAMGVGFMTVYNTPLSALYVQAMNSTPIAAYADSFIASASPDNNAAASMRGIIKALLLIFRMRAAHLCALQPLKVLDT